MKAISTIQYHIRRLQRIAEDESHSYELRSRCYDTYHALRWVIEETSWTPSGLVEMEIKNKIQNDN